LRESNELVLVEIAKAIVKSEKVDSFCREHYSKAISVEIFPDEEEPPFSEQLPYCGIYPQARNYNDTEDTNYLYEIRVEIESDKKIKYENIVANNGGFEIGKLCELIKSEIEELITCYFVNIDEYYISIDNTPLVAYPRFVDRIFIKLSKMYLIGDDNKIKIRKDL
jgi:hypothetical protein